MKKNILVLVDWSNISFNMDSEPPERFSPTVGFERFLNWLKEEGDIFSVFVFTDKVHGIAYADFFYQLGFYTIVCPRINTERGEIDTTDETLRKFGELMIENAPEITHLCIASGDYDFIGLARKAKLTGKKVMIMAADYKSLSDEFAKIADKDESGKPMIHIFHPIID